MTLCCWSSKEYAEAESETESYSCPFFTFFFGHLKVIYFSFALNFWKKKKNMEKYRSIIRNHYLFGNFLVIKKVRFLLYYHDKSHLIQRISHICCWNGRKHNPLNSTG